MPLGYAGTGAIYKDAYEILRPLYAKYPQNVPTTTWMIVSS